MELNENLEVIAIEATAQSRVLLAVKSKTLTEMDDCLQIVVGAQSAYPTGGLDLIARATTFNAFDFVDEDEKARLTMRLKRLLTEQQVEKINRLFEGNTLHK